MTEKIRKMDVDKNRSKITEESVYNQSSKPHAELPYLIFGDIAVLPHAPPAPLGLLL